MGAQHLFYINYIIEMVVSMKLNKRISHVRELLTLPARHGSNPAAHAVQYMNCGR